MTLNILTFVCTIFLTRKMMCIFLFNFNYSPQSSIKKNKLISQFHSGDCTLNNNNNNNAQREILIDSRHQHKASIYLH